MAQELHTLREHTCVHNWFIDGSVLPIFLVFCVVCVLILCLMRSIFPGPMVSGLSILDCPSDFLSGLFARGKDYNFIHMFLSMNVLS